MLLYLRNMKNFFLPTSELVGLCACKTVQGETSRKFKIPKALGCEVEPILVLVIAMAQALAFNYPLISSVNSWAASLRRPQREPQSSYQRFKCNCYLPRVLGGSSTITYQKRGSGLSSSGYSWRLEYVRR